MRQGGPGRRAETPAATARRTEPGASGRRTPPLRCHRPRPITSGPAPHHLRPRPRPRPLPAPRSRQAPPLRLHRPALYHPRPRPSASPGQRIGAGNHRQLRDRLASPAAPSSEARSPRCGSPSGSFGAHSLARAFARSPAARAASEPWCVLPRSWGGSGQRSRGRGSGESGLCRSSCGPRPCGVGRSGSLRGGCRRDSASPAWPGRRRAPVGAAWRLCRQGLGGPAELSSRVPHRRPRGPLPPSCSVRWELRWQVAPRPRLWVLRARSEKAPSRPSV